MTDLDFESLRAKLDEFSLRLNTRLREFEQGGALVTTNASLATRLLADQASVEIELEATMHRGSPWNATWIELERDVNALIGDFSHLEQRLDAQMVKRHGDLAA